MSAFCAQSLALAGPVGDTAGRIHRLDPRAKLLGLTGVTLVAVSAPPQAWPAYVGCAAALAAVAVAACVPASVIWRRSRVVLPVILFVAAFVPFLRPGVEIFAAGPFSVSREGLAIFLAVAAKAAIGTVSAVLLGATTSFPGVLQALDALRVPRLFTLIAAFMYRYLFVIADEVGRMRSALAARGYRPRNALQAAAMGRVATALFLRSHGRGERVYLAMVARGYRGSMPVSRPLGFGLADAAFLLALALALLPLRIALEMSA